MKFHRLGLMIVLVAAFLGAAHAAPQAISDEDAARYTRIFEAQEAGNWQSADKDIAALQDTVLMGYVLHQRYMHPTKYKASYTELKKWLDDYADHTNAEKVYNLAIARRPKNYKRPVKFERRQWRQKLPTVLHPELQVDYDNTARLDHTKWIEGRVRWYNSDDRPTQALNFLKKHKRSLTPRQYDRALSWIAASYYYNKRFDLAKRYSREAASRYGDTAVLSYWIAGLDAWRRNEFDVATEYFNKMADVEVQDQDLRSAAAFWAGRGALVSGKIDLVTKNLSIGAQYPYTFYGQLCLGALGMEGEYNFTPPSLTQENWGLIANASPRVKRAMALAQAGQNLKSQEEVRWAYGEITPDLDAPLLALAAELRHPAAQIDIALTSGALDGRRPELEGGLYPTPDFTPNGGFTLDKAVLYGISRQESKFRTDAKSRVGAAGLMQLMPRTASYMANDRTLRYKSGRSRLYDPGYNMQLGQDYVEKLLNDHTNGDMFEMALSYNWGPGSLRRYKKSTGIKDQLLLLESIPNHEARNFVEHVMTNIWVYRAKFGQPAPSRDAASAGGKAIYQSVEHANLEENVTK